MPGSFFKRRIGAAQSYKKALETYEMAAKTEYDAGRKEHFYKILKDEAIIRMVEIVEEETESQLILFYGHIDPSLQLEKKVPSGFSYIIELKGALFLNRSDGRFREILETGRFVFADNHVVILHPKYVYTDADGQLHLTEYATLHEDECCLKFQISSLSDVCRGSLIEYTMSRDERSRIILEVNYTGGYENSSLQNQQELLKDTIVKEQKLYNSLPNDYLKSWETVFQWAGVNYKEVAERTGMNPETVSRIVRGKTNGTINNIVLMCLALHLPYKVSCHLIEKSPCSLSYQDPNHIVYDFALRVFYGLTVEEVKERIAQLGADPL